MRELLQQDRLRAGDEVLSPSGRHALHYDARGAAVLTDRQRAEVRWRSEPGRLFLDGDGVLRVEDGTGGPVRSTGLACPGAEVLVVTDDGDLELLSGERVRLLNSRLGPVGVTAVAGAAPAAAITADRYLFRQGEHRQVVARTPDGSLRVTTDEPGSWSFTLPARLARWLEQDGTVLTWRILPNGERLAWTLCLVDASGDLRWRENPRQAHAYPPPARPHAHGGPELPRGGRLRHQSLTSPGGSRTLVHEDDGNLVLYANPSGRALWSTGTWWAGDGWVDLTDAGDLVVRNSCGAPVWRAGARDGQRLRVGDDGGVALLDALGREVWGVRAGSADAVPFPHVGRGPALRRGQSLGNHSLTSADGGTVLVCQAGRRLVLFGPGGQRLWERYLWETDRAHLALDDDGVLRLRARDGSAVARLAGPADELVVLPGEAVLRCADGTVVWRTGRPPRDYTSWLSALVHDGAYCATVVHDIDPDEALRRLGARPGGIATGTWSELRKRVDPDSGVAVAAFTLGWHTLLVQAGSRLAPPRPNLSAGTFAVTCCREAGADPAFLVFRDGAVVADHRGGDPGDRPRAPEVRRALAAMGVDSPARAAVERDLELLCRTAEVHPTPLDVVRPARIAVIGRG
ncbi:DUF6461 domain-containing protein [Saccharothrix syringae]|uniref:Curculin domain-containing protein (Mannose-binding) lectin n=1 Tax=Saccharothrix syringae TaxID=103733 RepID=A0A5Q0GX93_SACSY|nr:DUF6461 domain-containing protein [Saccharothrix syringae]QFZ18599.1 Curculin domain-containing protein (mannose-binding) lectin [Saccharothrix syringae]